MDVLAVLLILWLPLSAGVGFLASQRGRSGFGWALLSILTSPLLGLIIVLLTRDLKVEAADREREEARHREQLAALVGNRTGGAHLVQASATAEKSTDARQQLHAPLLLADELEKLGALRDRGLLTNEEFSEQKGRLLGTGAVRSTEQMTAPEPSKREAVSGDLSSIDKCTAELVALGCRVTRPSEQKWAVMQPSGGTVYAYSLDDLQSVCRFFQSPA